MDEILLAATMAWMSANLSANIALLPIPGWPLMGIDRHISGLRIANRSGTRRDLTYGVLCPGRCGMCRHEFFHEGGRTKGWLRVIAVAPRWSRYREPRPEVVWVQPWGGEKPWHSRVRSQTGAVRPTGRPARTQARRLRCDHHVVSSAPDSESS